MQAMTQKIYTIWIKSYVTAKLYPVVSILYHLARSQKESKNYSFKIPLMSKFIFKGRCAHRTFGADKRFCKSPERKNVFNVKPMYFSFR